MTALIERNTTIPAERKNTFSTAADNQTAVTVRVFQGERKMAEQNRLLGEFNLEGLPPCTARRAARSKSNSTSTRTAFCNVSARDLGSGKEASVRIEQSSGLSKTEIERMQKDAEEHAEEDRRQFELAESRNKAQHLIYQLEKQMKENAEKLTDNDREPLNKAIEKTSQGIGRQRRQRDSQRHQRTGASRSSIRQGALRKGRYCASWSCRFGRSRRFVGR